MDILRELKKKFGFNNFKGNQKVIIENLLDGNDTFVIMPTGGGKSLCYQLPALLLEGMAVIVSPLIALMKNQVDVIRGHLEDEGVAHVLNSSLSKSDLEKVKYDVTHRVTKLLYIAPESLTKEENYNFLKSVDVSFFAIDEAHCISEWGHDFRPEYRNLKALIEKVGNYPIIALTATATPKVQDDIQKNLGMINAKVFKSSFNRPNLYYEVRPKVNVNAQIIKYIKERYGKHGIVYCLSRKKVEEITELLQINGIKAAAYHAGLDAKTRAKHQDMFLMQEVDVIVATIAFGMGIDKPNVRFVIHHDMPKSLEGYYQETGRAGRDGGEGNCIAFYNHKDIEKLEKFMLGKPLAEREVGYQLLQEVVAYAETSMSRRKFILHYFGEDFDQVNGKGADMDDNVRYPKEKIEVKDEMTLLLKTVEQSHQQYKSKEVSNILTGNKDSVILKGQNIFSKPYFGKGEYKDEKFWMAIIRQAIVNKYLIKNIESYGVLKLSHRGREFIKKPISFKMPKDHNYDELEKSSSIQKAGSGSDRTLFKLLKELTIKVAKNNKIPPFAVFQETSLEDMCLSYPITMDDLKNIQGVGEGKAKKFGIEFLVLIKKYVKDNNIERPDDFIIKSIANKSDIKIHIIKNTDRKMALEDIARSKGLDMNQLITEIENVVNSGN